MRINAEKFSKGHFLVNNVIIELSSSDLLNIKSYPDNLKTKDVAEDILDGINSISTNLKEIEMLISNTHRVLCDIDTDFAINYSTIMAENVRSNNFLCDLEFNSSNVSKSCYDKIEYDKNSNFYETDKVDTSGKIENFTDYQNCLTAEINVNNFNKLLLSNDYDYSGKTIFELYESGAYGNSRKLIDLINDGFGDFKIIEVVDGEAGFDVVVLQDVDGNYLVSFPCTDATESSDIIYDIEHILPIDLQNMSETFNLPLSASYKKQKKQAYEIAEKYFKKAKEEGNTINISGYSLGGGLAEETYLSLCKDFFGYKDNDTIGELIVFDPCHNNLNKLEVDFFHEMYEKGKINIYSAEGSTVSTYYNHDDLKDITNFIYVDYYNQYKKSLTYEKGLAEEFIDNKVDLNYISFDVHKALSSILSKDEISNLKFVINNAKLLYSGAAHNVENIKIFADVSFDEKGNVRKVVQKHDENGEYYEYEVQPLTFQEITKEIFGTDLSQEVKILNDFSYLCNDLAKLSNDFDGVSFSELIEAFDNLKDSYRNNTSSFNMIMKIFGSGAIYINEKNIDKIKKDFGDKGFGIFNVENAIDFGTFLYDGVNSGIDFVKEVWDTGTKAVSDAWDSSVNFVKEAWDTGTKVASDAWDSCANFAKEAWDTGTKAASDAWDSGVNFVKGAWDTGTKAVGNAWNGFLDIFS